MSGPTADARLEFLRRSGAGAIAHIRGDLLSHLQGVSAVLAEWGSRPALVDAGLFHSVYGTEFLSAQAVGTGQRDTVREVIGAEAEEIAWLWHAVRRASIAANARRASAPLIVLRDGASRALTRQQLMDLATLWLADAVEQLRRASRASVIEARGVLAPLLALAEPGAAEAARAFLAKPPPPRVHLYAACWNEAEMIPFFLRHYEPWVERFVIFDDGSSDASPELLSRHPKVELRRLAHSRPDSLVLSLCDLYDGAWKESRGTADWVAVVNMDEHLHHRHMPAYLEACGDCGITAIPALGYDMVGEGAPNGDRPLSEILTRGAPQEHLSKLGLFSPDAIAETRFAVGRHKARPRGRVGYPARDELLLLHFKCLSPARLTERLAAQNARLRSRDRAEGWGGHYGWTAAEAARWAGELDRKAVHVLAIDDPHRAHPGARWWRLGPLGTARRLAARASGRLRSVLRRTSQKRARTEPTTRPS